MKGGSSKKPVEPVYRRSNNRELNIQNAHISISYELCNFALLALMQMGITVQEIHLVGRQPKITVMASAACKKLRSEVFSIKGDGGKRTNIRRATVNGCLVEWECSLLH